jgi:hypothetical protein
LKIRARFSFPKQGWQGLHPHLFQGEVWLFRISLYQFILLVRISENLKNCKKFHAITIVQEIIKLRKRMRDLFSESGYENAIKTITDWECVLLGYMNIYLPLDEHRNILSAKKTCY